MKIEAVKHIVWVSDMEKALSFYRDVLGLRDGSVSPHWSELRFGDAVIALHAGAGPGDRDTGLSFQVSDVDGACLEVSRGGGRVLDPPQQRPGEPIRLGWAADPDGNRFALTQFMGTR